MASIMTVRAPDDLQQLLRNIARKQGQTRNALILCILQEWVDRNKTDGAHESDCIE